ncbi:hypothetical protein AXG93_4620s1340 [Marchantia polymorpha subsp. ruderalis]|nr:hypothetical protein AXG93_4620s1340 [Marchantia polymorpha subsp. ruderalis]
MLRRSAGAVLALSNFLLVMVAGLVDNKRGEVFAVGGAAGWRVPQSGKVNYTEWASMLSTLNVGDTLLFTYPTGEHNVVQVGEEDFGRCKAISPIATYTDGQTLVNLPKEGRYHFMCSFPRHCLLGQKFMVDVVVPSFRAPAPAPLSGNSDPHIGGPKNSPMPNAASGPDSAFAPVASLSISPAPSAFGPSAPNPDNSARAMRVRVLALAVFSLMSFFFI